MYETKHFIRAIHILLAMGFIGFAIAAESPGTLIVGVGLTVLHAILTRGPQNWHPPHFLSVAVSFIAVALVAMGIARGQLTPVLGFSYLLVTLILVKLFEWRSNRDIGQGLVMSLLLMTASAINSASLVFGALFIVYLLLGLYVSLLLHLKTESDRAVAAFAIPGDRLPLSQGQGQAQRSLRRSLRQITTVVACAAIASAVAVFLFFPRSSSPPIGGGSFGLTKSTPMTGFSDRVSFDQVARITQNTDMVARLRVTRHGETLKPGVLYFRGTTLSLYSGGVTNGNVIGRWEWFHAPAIDSPTVVMADPGVPVALVSAEHPNGPDSIEQEITLEPTGSRVMFSLAGPTTLTAEQPLRVMYEPDDESVKLLTSTRTAIRYHLMCSGELGGLVTAPPPAPATTVAASSPEMPEAWPQRLWHRGGGRGRGGDSAAMFRWLALSSRIDPKITAYARRKEVSGQSASGAALAGGRTDQTAPDPLDETLARNIEQHLQSTFSYTLDLSDTTRAADQDPLVSFLYDNKRGHCEYFAGAMTLLCQSLGMKARMVIGFRLGGEDLNPMGEYYIVRQSHAHAWVEVLTSRGWLTFDPTSGRTAPHKTGVFARAGNLWDYLQYKWSDSVITYSAEDRQNLVEDLGAELQAGSNWTSDAWAKLRGLLRPEGMYELSSRILAGTIAIAVLAAMAAVGVFVNEKYRLRRRALRIGLEALPDSDKLRLARQLEFYDQFLQLLARHKITRPRSLTPREFAQSLTFLPARAYDRVCQFTEVFYQVRFGQRDLSPARQRRLINAIQDLARLLAGPTPP